MRYLIIILLIVFIIPMARAEDHPEAMQFLMANMPAQDHALTQAFLDEDIKLAYKAIHEVPWGTSIPEDIFLNNVLPYASLNERRDNWRPDFYHRFIKIAKHSKNIDEAVEKLNLDVFRTFRVYYNLTKRPKPDQSPYESIKAHYASCTGLSILLVDALRSVGIAARIAATPMWPDQSGNHTWVEIWDGSWHYIGAGEVGALDHTWFTQRASTANEKYPIFAASFKKTNLIFPMRWAPELTYVSAVDVTRDYKSFR